ncbi:elongation factor 4 [bacterium]|nr:elongation factor 4 [bacterium]
MGKVEAEEIRNFCIVAHVDHGKSTLADRILELTGAVPKEKMRAQYMDQLDIERERGITIKAAAARLSYRSGAGKAYQLNLIDTPGHVDFSYEVSRSLAACEGALLVVDVSQGVEAQTVSNFLLAKASKLAILPVLNKCDLKQSDVERTTRQLRELGVDITHLVKISAKTGEGVPELLEKLVTVIPPPRSRAGEDPEILKALIIDSSYDNYRGVVATIRIFSGRLVEQDRVRLWAAGVETVAAEVGVFSPVPVRVKQLGPGQVGYVAAGWKSMRDVAVGDTLVRAASPPSAPLPGYQRVKPMVYAGLFPTDGENFEALKNGLQKLALNDSSLTIEPEVSDALGFGFKCGFLGLLHMEIVSERLSKELGIETLLASPTVVYRVYQRQGAGETMVEVKSASEMPKEGADRIEEPRIRALIFTPTEMVGPVMQLLEDRRGVLEEMNYLDPRKVILTYDLPLSEVITDFYDRLKSLTRGYASFDYEFKTYAPADMRKLDVLLNGKEVDALSLIVHKDSAARISKSVSSRLAEAIPRQLFEVVVQVASNGRIIARETIRALRKNVTAKCYGGDITRKRKLLEKQREGKKRMKQIGTVEIPKEAFLSILKSGDLNPPSAR